jgi:hypothetical protein
MDCGQPADSCNKKIPLRAAEKQEAKGIFYT